MNTPDNRRFQQERQPALIMQRPKKRKQTFRFSLLYIPLGLIIAYYIFRHVQISGLWNNVMEGLHVHDKENYTRLAKIGLILVLVVAISRLFKPSK